MRKVMIALAILAIFALPVLADTVTHLTASGQGYGPDQQTAYNNAYANGDSVLRAGCLWSSNNTLINEKVDSVQYQPAFTAPWMATVAMEGDCDQQNGN